MVKLVIFTLFEALIVFSDQISTRSLLGPQNNLHLVNSGLKVIDEPLRVSSDLICPKYTCSRSSQSSCVNETSEGWLITKCKRGFDCSFSYENISKAACIADVDSSDNEACYASYLSLNSPCSFSDFCEPGTFCSLESLTCQAKALKGENCSQLYQCSENTVCNFGKCIDHFSVLPFDKSESPVACTSGIVKDYVCQPEIVTNGSFPKVCSSDSDCLASDGVTEGQCKCGFNAEGSAYCLPHRSDKVNKEFLAASYNGNYDEIRFFQYRASHFIWIVPEFTQSYETCLDEALEVENYEDLADIFLMCSPICSVTGCFEYGLD